MPNPVPAAAEGLPISRRKALGLMAAVSIPPTAAVAVAAAQPLVGPTPLQQLLDRHAAALAADTAAWDLCSELDSLPEMESLQLPKVQLAESVMAVMTPGTNFGDRAMPTPKTRFTR